MSEASALRPWRFPTLDAIGAAMADFEEQDTPEARAAVYAAFAAHDALPAYWRGPK